MKLVTFNRDWADEHNVSALQCFTEEEYQDWLETEITKLDPDYEQLNNEFEEKLQKYKDFQNACEVRGLRYGTIERHEDMEWMEQNYTPAVYSYNRPSKGQSKLYANLGNSGDGFGENYENYHYAKELVMAGIVKVFDVNEDFHKYFHLANLSNLSLCNVFEIEE